MAKNQSTTNVWLQMYFYFLYFSIICTSTDGSKNHWRQVLWESGIRTLAQSKSPYQTLLSVVDEVQQDEQLPIKPVLNEIFTKLIVQNSQSQATGESPILTTTIPPPSTSSSRKAYEDTGTTSLISTDVGFPTVVPDFSSSSSFTDFPQPSSISSSLTFITSTSTPTPPLKSSTEFTTLSNIFSSTTPSISISSPSHYSTTRGKKTDSKAEDPFFKNKNEGSPFNFFRSSLFPFFHFDNVPTKFEEKPSTTERTNIKFKPTTTTVEAVSTTKDDFKKDTQTNYPIDEISLNDVKLVSLNDGGDSNLKQLATKINDINGFSSTIKRIPMSLSNFYSDEEYSYYDIDDDYLEEIESEGKKLKSLIQSKSVRSKTTTALPERSRPTENILTKTNRPINISTTTPNFETRFFHMLSKKHKII